MPIRILRSVLVVVQTREVDPRQIQDQRAQGPGPRVEPACGGGEGANAAMSSPVRAFHYEINFTSGKTLSAVNSSLTRNALVLGVPFFDPSSLIGSRTS